MPTLTDPLLIALNTERLRQNLTMQAWAERAGVNVHTVYRLVRGERLGHMSVVRALARAVGLELCTRELSKAGRP